MTSIAFGNETRLQEWSRREFDLTYSEICCLVALVAGHRITGGEPILQQEVSALAVTFEGKHGGHAFASLERKGLLVRGPNMGGTGHERTWHPTSRGIRRVLGPLVAELKSGPGLVGTSSELVEEVA
jgi:hypothetical protein